MTEAIEFHNACSKECINSILLSGNILIYYMQTIVPVAELASNHEGKVRCSLRGVSTTYHVR